MSETDFAGIGLAIAYGFTVTTALPAVPEIVAEIVTGPGATPVTTPSPLTVAVDGDDVAHVARDRLVDAPRVSIADAINCAVPPTLIVFDPGTTKTVAIVGLGVVVVIPPPESAQPTVQSRTTAESAVREANEMPNVFWRTRSSVGLSHFELSSLDSEPIANAIRSQGAAG